ncbi:OmpH family outer membrane protein [Phaeobacter porticola]|uniref:Putative outer membrane protein n=1 Tax=Phaeobacter porticola TaxID=1844006 RepID=A0A1L3I411_9RHOB|nr:OmpH family outer membrane protein [Phaeobacter porticola]APG46846.1 putative outer membrane protein [Phaeobacter porticola]
MKRAVDTRHRGALAGWLAPFVLSLLGLPMQSLSVTAQEAILPPAGFPVGETLQLGAPQNGLLTIQSERLYAESAFGQRVSRELDAEGAVLTAENRRIEAELRAEELDLTARRSSMDPAAFRALADAFDEKVQETRRSQDQKLREINQMGEDARRDFFTASLPVLQQIMREAGAGAILEHANVFLSADAADITDLAISRINNVLGSGESANPGTGDD